MPDRPKAAEMTAAAAKPHRVSTYAFSGCLARWFGWFIVPHDRAPLKPGARDVVNAIPHIDPQRPGHSAILPVPVLLVKLKSNFKDPTPMAYGFTGEKRKPFDPEGHVRDQDGDEVDDTITDALYVLFPSFTLASLSRVRFSDVVRSYLDFTLKN